MDIGEIVKRIVGGAGILIGVYLIVTNPTGDKVATNSLSGAFNSGVKSLQGR